MPFAHLVGIFPRPEKVVELSRAVERRRASSQGIVDRYQVVSKICPVVNRVETRGNTERDGGKIFLQDLIRH